MIKKQKIALSLVLLGLIAISPVGGSVARGDTLLQELQRNDWREYFSGSGAREGLNKSIDELLDLIYNGGIDWRIRIRGIVLLSETEGPRKVDNLMEMFMDPFFSVECPAIKTSLVRALSSMVNDRRVVDVLMKGADDGELQVREAAVLALGKAGDGRAVPLLIDKLSDQSFAVRLGAIRSLVEIKDPRAIPPLKEIAGRDRDKFIRDEAMAALEKIKS